MEEWTQHEGLALALPIANIDTDQLIPARFMSTSRANGYGDFLLHDVRRDAQGNLLSDFLLNRHLDASILIAGRNFGSGSSREAAVYALVDAGIRAVFAGSFGDIFVSNAINNGLLAATVGTADAGKLMHAAKLGTKSRVNLEAGEIQMGKLIVKFLLDHNHRTKLMNGWDDIDLTLHHLGKINEFRRSRHQTAAWALPSAGN